MIWVYAGILAAAAAGMLLTRSYGKAFFRTLDRRKHRLLILYPLAGWLLARWKRIRGRGVQGRVSRLLKSLYVKENVEKERYLYQVRKIAFSLAVWIASCMLGFLTCCGAQGITWIRSLQRGDYGQEPVNYELGVEYRNSQDKVDVSVEAVHYTRSEILDLFERSYEEVKRIVLGDNEDQDHVTKPLNLIREFGEFSIYWDIEDLDTMNYNGQISPELKEGEERVCSLFATFSLDDVTQIYTIPLKIRGELPGEREALIKSIREAVEQENDIHERKVKLPEEIDGYPIRFFRGPEQTGPVLLLLGLAAAAVIFLLYDRRLEEQVKKRKEQMMMDFPEIVSKLTLLYEAGLSIHGAFERIVEDYEKRLRQNTGSDDPEKESYRFAYKEMKLALEKIRNGESEGQAYAGFGRRCGIHVYIKLGNLLEQNLNKGAKGLQMLLTQEVQQAQEVQKRIARKKGEEAGTKLLLPMMLLLMVVIAIIAVPALMSVSSG